MNTSKKVYVVDFDNVVVRGSEEAKARAWTGIWGPYEDKALELFREAEGKYGRGRGGDRFTIIRYVFEHLGKSGDELEGFVKKVSDDFDAAVQDYIARTGIERSDREALEEMKRRGPLYLNTATPLEAVTRSVNAIGVEELFTGLLGRPKTKVENFKEVLAKEGVTPLDVLYIGDSDSDWKVAQEVGVNFLGLATEENGWSTKEMPFRVIRHLREAL